MAKESEFFGVKFKEGSLEPKVSELIRFAVNLAIGNESGVKRHLEEATRSSPRTRWTSAASMPSSAIRRMAASRLPGWVGASLPR